MNPPELNNQNFHATLPAKALGEIYAADATAFDSFLCSRLVQVLIDGIWRTVKRLAGACGRQKECPKRIPYGWLYRSRSVPTSFFVHRMKSAFEKCMPQDAPPNAARKSKSRLSLPPSLLAVLVLPWLAVSMPVNATGGSDKKDSVTVAQDRSQEVSTGQPAGDFVLSEKKGLLSLKAVGVELVQVLAALSRASEVPIKLIDDAGERDKLTISFQERTIQEAVREVISTLSPGGLVSIGGGSGNKLTIYVITKQGADSFRSKAQAMIDRVNRRDNPTPVELQTWLPDIAAVGFPIDPQGTSIFLVPVLKLLDANYSTYEASVSSLFRDQSVVRPLRSAMLEIIAHHWTYPDSRNSLLTVFDRSTDDVVLQGQISLTLATHGDAIGDKLIERYSAAAPEARFYYAQALAALDRKDAIALLLEDAMQRQHVPLRSASIAALIKLDPGFPSTSHLVHEVIHAAKPVSLLKRSVSDLDNERIAMHAVVAIGQFASPETIQALLGIASDESVAVDVRLTALESLAANAATMPHQERTALYDQVAEVRQRVTESEQLDKTNKERMFVRIEVLQNLSAAQ